MKMLRRLRSRRRPRDGAQLCCAIISAILLLLSVSLLYSRLSNTTVSNSDAVTSRLLSDSSDSLSSDFQQSDDKIDELDIVEEDSTDSRRFVNEDQDDDDEEQGLDLSTPSSNYFYDHVAGAIRRGLNRRSIEDWDDESSEQGFGVGLFAEDGSKRAFATDDLPLDEGIRRKLSEVVGVEDALFLRVNKKESALREGWGDWFEKKSDFLRKDRMFKTSFEALNPLNNPLLLETHGVSVTGFTRGDRLVQKWLLRELERLPSSFKKPPVVSDTVHRSNSRGGDSKARTRSRKIVKSSDNQLERVSEIRRAERRTLDDNVNNDSNKMKISASKVRSDRSRGSKEKRYMEFEGNIYADGTRWGYYPGLDAHLSFSDFVDEFFRREKCQMRVFMVWNSPTWMFSVRHQRGLESLLVQHPDACVVVLSETIELNFFKDSFLKAGYKVAVAMPNLEELLKNTPSDIFASVWFEWRKTKFYPTHFSELVRLAALYKYGGIYLDSDIIVLKPLTSLNNTVGQEDQIDQHSLNGAIMAFSKHSPFLMECLKEYYLSYDDTRLRWNGADLLRRVAAKLPSNRQKDPEKLELKVQPPFIFFPISRHNITRYFISPTTETEKAKQDLLYKKILDEAMTFHFWNSLTSSLVPEPESLVSKLIDHACIHCSDVL